MFSVLVYSTLGKMDELWISLVILCCWLSGLVWMINMRNMFKYRLPHPSFVTHGSRMELSNDSGWSYGLLVWVASIFEVVLSCQRQLGNKTERSHSFLKILKVASDGCYFRTCCCGSTNAGNPDLVFCTYSEAWSSLEFLRQMLMLGGEARKQKVASQNSMTGELTRESGF